VYQVGTNKGVFCGVGNGYRTIIYMCVYHMKGGVVVEVMLCKPVFAYLDREAET